MFGTEKIVKKPCHHGDVLQMILYVFRGVKPIERHRSATRRRFE